MKYNELEDLVSSSRLDRYLVACGNSKVKAQRLYNANLRVSQAFYPVLNIFEIILRNKVHTRLSNYFANQNWMTAEKTGFMSDHSLRKSRFYLRQQIIKTERKLGARQITPGKVIAEQTFGFWSALFEPHHYRLIGGTIINCFPNKPPAVNRSIISVKLQKIRDFRNRIYHNEPICFNQNFIDFQTPKSIKKNISELLSWISNDAKAYAEKFDNIDSKILVGKRI